MMMIDDDDNDGDEDADAAAAADNDQHTMPPFERGSTELQSLKLR